MFYDIDIYENIAINNVHQILVSIENFSHNRDKKLLSLEMPLGFALLLKKYLDEDEISYPIAYETPSFIKDIPIICTQDQILILSEANQAIYVERLNDFRSRYNKILLKLKKISKIQEENIELFLKVLGFLYHDKNDMKEYIVSVDNKQIAEKTSNDFTLKAIDNIYIR